MSRHINLPRYSVRLTGAAVFIASAAPAMAADEPPFAPFGDDISPFDSSPVVEPPMSFESVFDVSPPAADDAAADVDAKLMQSSMTEVLGNPVSDEELGQMRGKFVSPQNISFFGISMVTSWQDQAGVTTMANLAFNVDFLKDGGGSPGSPQVLVSYVRGASDCTDMDVTGHSDGYVALTENPQQVLPIGALDTLNGAGQVNVIAGKNNETGNNMRIAVVPRSMVPAVNNNEGTALTSSMNLTFGDGDQLQFKVGKNEVGLVMTGNNGMDTTLQSVGGDLGYLLQQTTLNSDSNHIMNNATVMFGVDDTVAKTLDRVSADGAMMAMKGFGF